MKEYLLPMFAHGPDWIMLGYWWALFPLSLLAFITGLLSKWGGQQWLGLLSSGLLILIGLAVTLKTARLLDDTDLKKIFALGIASVLAGIVIGWWHSKQKRGT